MSTGCLNELGIMRRDCKSSTKSSLKSRAYSLYKIHRESTYKENDREGRVSHWGAARETEALTKEKKEGLGVVTVCELKKKKKKSGNHRSEKERG